MADGNSWSNDFSDVNNLSKTLGSDKSKQQQQAKEKKRFIDSFYPFIHTARIEQLYVMETTTKEPLPRNLITAGERAEYVEIGIIYGLKESAMIVVLFLLFTIIQIFSTLKYPTPLTTTINLSMYFVSLIAIGYGTAYTMHIAKYNVGFLTEKVIHALLLGRFIIIMIVIFLIGWVLKGLETYMMSNITTLLMTADAIVPDRDGGWYGIIGNILSIPMIPFGGGFPVTEESLAYILSIVIPKLFEVWVKISFVISASILAPIVFSMIHRSNYDSRNDKAQKELDNY